ncbi:hypothetical protein F511_40773 [Dorcoceras hygrometricum]|uniref:Uncharacterized protein n=1 Tax=Dorcoceras hygrometricum TaxID=472368 RepID=A0A2Z7A9A3_9LAMI|nr:hypothetical protein F511_40773 [Dorcoceras hygrometricum]
MESAVMTSALMSSQSVVGNQQTKKAAGALSVDDISSDVIIQHVATVISRKLSTDEKSSAKGEETSCWRISRWFSVDYVIGDVITISRWFERAVARISSWMSTAELNSNGKNDKEPAKENDASTIPCRYFTRHNSNGKNVVSNGINFYRGFIYKGSAIEEVFETLVQLQYFSHTVEAVVHLRSLGVLTAAGCGIGSVHEVVRSDLLVEPFEVEEGEISVSGALLVVSFYLDVQEQRAIAAPSSAENIELLILNQRLLSSFRKTGTINWYQSRLFLNEH